MLNVSLSPSVDEITCCVNKWPATTKPWVVATVISDRGTIDAHLQTVCCDSGLEMACTLLASNLALLSAQCFLADQQAWTVREVEEVLIGMLGEASVVVFRDSSGCYFCPDAPTLSPSHLTDLASTCVVSKWVSGPVTQFKGSADERLRHAIAKLLQDRSKAALSRTQ